MNFPGTGRISAASKKDVAVAQTYGEVSVERIEQSSKSSPHWSYWAESITYRTLQEGDSPSYGMREVPVLLS